MLVCVKVGIPVLKGDESTDDSLLFCFTLLNPVSVSSSQSSINTFFPSTKLSYAFKSKSIGWAPKSFPLRSKPLHLLLLPAIKSNT